MQLEILKYLNDVLISIEVVEQHTSHIHSFSEFNSNLMLTDAVQRRLAIIGEAVWQITRTEKDFKLTDIRKISGFRYLLVHEYDLITLDIVWVIVKKHLPVLKTEVINYLNS